MIIITESSRDNPCELKCDCGDKPVFVIHHDIIEGYCTTCKKQYVIPMTMENGTGIWNCCSKPKNGCGFDCIKGKEWEKLIDMGK